MKKIVSLTLVRLSIMINLLALIVTNQICGIDYLKKPKRILLKQEDENKRILTQGDWEPIRIHLDYSYIENNINRFSRQDLIDLKDRIMPKTQEVFQNLLKVKRIQHKLKLNAPSCENFPIPENYHSSGEGVIADLVIFVLLDDTGDFDENKIEAAAIHCLQHFETRRPIAGYIQFKQNLSVTNSTALDYMVWLAVHEITHILMMNDALYDDYIDPNTLIPYGYDRIVGQKDLPNGKKMNYLKTPKVLEKAKRHFGCNSIDGVPLEYNGGSGTAGAHWSKKFMNTDYMIGDSYGENLISDITLGLFEDSGWYKVDYELSNLFLWGKDKGCDFFKSKCINNKNKQISTQFPDEFCTKLNYPLCSISNIFRGYCATKRYKKELNIYERYFDDPRLGGIDSLTDKCPIAKEDKGNEIYYGGSCRVGDTSSIGLLEKVCPECSCFMSTLDLNQNLRKNSLRFNKKLNNSIESPNNSSSSLLKPHVDDEEDDPILTPNDPTASCYQFNCKGSELYLIINNNKYKCPSNTNLKIEGYKGYIICPKNEVLCHRKYNCKFGCTERYSNSVEFQSFRLKGSLR